MDKSDVVEQPLGLRGRFLCCSWMCRRGGVKKEGSGKNNKEKEGVNLGCNFFLFLSFFLSFAVFAVEGEGKKRGWGYRGG